MKGLFLLIGALVILVILALISLPSFAYVGSGSPLAFRVTGQIQQRSYGGETYFVIHTVNGGDMELTDQSSKEPRGQTCDFSIQGDNPQAPSKFFIVDSGNCR